MMQKKILAIGAIVGLVAAVGAVWATTRGMRGAAPPPSPPAAQSSLASIEAGYTAPAGASKPWREVMAEKKAEAALPDNTEEIVPALDAPQPVGPPGGTLDLTQPAPEKDPVVLAQAPSGKSEDELRKGDAAIEEEEDKIPLDAAHKGYKPLSFKTLAGYKYEVFIPEEGSKPEDLPAEALKDQIPQSIKDLNGKKIAIRGFMVPTVVEVEGVRAFLLTRSRSLCCFGEMPEMNEWIDAELPKDKFTDFHSDVVITVYGTLEVGEQRDGGVVLSVYRMKVEDVVPLPGENVEKYYL